MSEYRIVVGVDGSPASGKALEWAIEEARLRGGSLRVITAWHYPVLGDAAGAAPDAEVFRQSAADDQAALLSAAGGEGSGLRGEVIEGSAVTVLLDAAREADLLVVGSRGHGGFAGLLLGSVSAQLVHHAPCPVLVVRENEGGRGAQP
jgi:nucleotide-binding universal stress UspA family protein